MDKSNRGRRHLPDQKMLKTQPSTLHSLLASHERLILIRTLAANGFSRVKAAEALGISRQHLWHRVLLLKIDRSVLPRRHPGRPRKKFT